MKSADSVREAYEIFKLRIAVEPSDANMAAASAFAWVLNDEKGWPIEKMIVLFRKAVEEDS